MLSDQLVQHRDPGQPLRQPTPGQHPAGLVFDLNVMVGLSPIVANKQHRASSLTIDQQAANHGEDLLRPNGSVLTGTTSHQHYRPPHQPPGHDLVIDLKQGLGLKSAHRQPARTTACPKAAIAVPLGIAGRANRV